MVEIVKADLSRLSRIGVASFSTVRRLIDDRSDSVRRTSNSRKINGGVCAFANVASNCNFIFRQYSHRGVPYAVSALKRFNIGLRAL